MTAPVFDPIKAFPADVQDDLSFIENFIPIEEFRADVQDALSFIESLTKQTLSNLSPPADPFELPASDFAPATDSWVKLSLDTFASSILNPAAETALPFKGPDLVPALALTPAPNAKIALAEALYPGIPVFGA